MHNVLYSTASRYCRASARCCVYESPLPPVFRQMITLPDAGQRPSDNGYAYSIPPLSCMELIIHLLTP